MSLFDKPFPLKRKVSTTHCADCGKKAELTYDRCQKCVVSWAKQVAYAIKGMGR